MASTYTSNQTGAIAALLAAGLFGITATGGAMMTTESRLPSAAPLLAVLIAIAWVLIPLYAKRIKWSYIIGIVIWIIALVVLAVDPGTPPWYMFEHPLFNFGFLIFYLVGIAGIIFSYRSYKEL